MEKKRIERPNQTIKANVTPVSNDIKVKLTAAFQSVINAIKAKHLS
jgi:hypothetical protein